MILDFEEQRNDFINKLENSKIGILATSLNDKVTVRSMSIINIDENVLFQTDKRMEKCYQITNNENVALCIGNIQIEGIARIKGKADKQNEFIEIF
jgi:general stress protein 26